MPIAVIGVSHRSAPIEVRERFAYAPTEVPHVLATLVASGIAEEAVVLSTCNRTEFYLCLPDLAAGEAAVRRMLAPRFAGTPEELGRLLYLHRDRGAVEHLYRVAGGLDSMVLGEPQIQGQVREAYQLAYATQTAESPVVGPTLNRLFQSALSVGGRVRSETEVGLGAASIPSAAVELAKKIFGSLGGRRALVVGAGEMSEVTLECLRGEGVQSYLVTNRTYDRAVEVAERWGGRAIHWDDLGSALPAADIVICSTSAPHPVLTRERFRRALPSGAQRPLCVIDIALPRDVEASVGEERNVFLYNIDDLRQIVDVNLERRRAEIPRAEHLVAEGVEEFWGWFAGLAVVPTIRALRERGEAVRREEVEKALRRRLAHLSPDDREAVEALTRSLLNKILHAPTVRLREAAGNGRGTVVLDTVHYLFELDSAAAEEAALDPRPPITPERDPT